MNSKLLLSVILMTFMLLPGVLHASSPAELPVISDRGSVKGKAVDMMTQQPLPGVNIVIMETSYGTTTDLNGEYELNNLPQGRYKIRASLVGYESVVLPELIITNARPASADFEMKQSTLELGDVTVTADYFHKELNTVNSITNFSYEEIRRSPGGFEDVVRALSILPGIAQADAGRNDLIVRGGAPSENLYTVDGVVVPNINHFGSQGSAGGPLSFIDLNFVKEVDFSTGGFPALYGDKLSSVMNITLGEGRTDRQGGRATISATQFGLNAEGPINDNMNFLFSARRSYLDFIFKAAGFGFVPEYYDMLGKLSMNAGKNDRLSFLFIGAFDNVRFFNKTSEQRYDNSRTLGNDQLQYISSLNYRHLTSRGILSLSLGRNFVDYDFIQRDTLLNPVFVNSSRESESSLKADLIHKLTDHSEISAGAIFRYIRFNADLRLPVFTTTFGDTLSVTSLERGNRYFKGGAYLQFTDKPIEQIGYNAGVRLDYFNAIGSPFTLSPRFSLSWYAGELTTFSLSTGLYYQAPSLIWLQGDSRNKELKSIRALHVILGVQRRLRADTQVRLEGFYKQYSDYPASMLRKYLILSNTGAGFGGPEDNYSSFALEHLVSGGKGNVRGVELQLQKKNSEIPYYGIMSFTYSRSEFTALDKIARPGSYDQQFMFNLSGGYIFNDKWEAAVKFRYSTGKPYTPFNSDGTQSVALYNSRRLPELHSLDLRLDRRWYFEKWYLIAYIDIQNIYNRKNISSVQWDYRKNEIKESSNIGILPSIGISAGF